MGGNRREILGDASAEFVEPHGARRLVACVGIKSGEREELLHEPRGAVDALVESDKALLLLLGRLGALGELHLQLQGGEGRTQFVGRVRGEALLGREAFLEAREKVIHGAHEPFEFRRESLGGNGGERRGRASCDRTGGFLKRGEALAHDEPDRDGDEGKEQTERL